MSSLAKLEPVKIEAVQGTQPGAAQTMTDALRGLIQRGVDLPLEVILNAAFVLKSLERIGDHARNVARLLQTFSGYSQPGR